MDETCLPTVFTKKGQKLLSKAVNGERGTTTTLIACVRATVSYIPPMFIYGRKMRTDVLLNGTPAGLVCAIYS